MKKLIPLLLLILSGTACTRIVYQKVPEAPNQEAPDPNRASNLTIVLQGDNLVILQNDGTPAIVEMHRDTNTSATQKFYVRDGWVSVQTIPSPTRPSIGASTMLMEPNRGRMAPEEPAVSFSRPIVPSDLDPGYRERSADYSRRRMEERAQSERPAPPAKSLSHRKTGSAKAAKSRAVLIVEPQPAVSPEAPTGPQPPAEPTPIVRRNLKPIH